MNPAHDRAYQRLARGVRLLPFDDLAEICLADAEHTDPIDAIVSRVTIDVMTASGHAAAVDFRIGADTIEIVCWGSTLAVLDRGRLRSWLRDPASVLRVGHVLLSFDTMVDTAGRIAISLPDVNAWTLAPTDAALLTSRV